MTTPIAAEFSPDGMKVTPTYIEVTLWVAVPIVIELTGCLFVVVPLMEVPGSIATTAITAITSAATRSTASLPFHDLLDSGLSVSSTYILYSSSLLLPINTTAGRLPECL